MRTGKAVLGILAGVATGAALGILFAPDKGENTRKKIVKKGEDLSDALNKKIDEKFSDLIDVITGVIKKANPTGEKSGTKQS